MIAAATPGLQHLLVLGKIKELERERAADLIVVDAPPAGHAAPFLRSATGLSDVVQSGPIRDQAEEVNAMLTDPARCRAMIVVLPEVTPVTEGLELAAEVGGELGIDLLPLVVNSCWPDRAGLDKSPAVAARSQSVKLSAASKRTLDSSAAFGRARLDQQRSQIDRLRTALDAEVITLPRLTITDLGRADLSELADALVDQ
jgi:anion-transporting  ArsA/GET3 family ATPase